MQDKWNRILYANMNELVFISAWKEASDAGPRNCDEQKVILL